MKRVLKWVGYIVGGIVAVVILFIAGVYVVTSSRMGKTYPTQVEAISVPTDPAAIERGRHLTQAVGKCTGCHGDNLTGKMISDDPVFARL